MVKWTPNTAGHSEPIAALASGSGGAIGIIRVSGQGCHDILLSCTKFKKESFSPKPSTLSLCEFVDPSLNDEVIDEPLVAFFNNPHSFTGEDCVEIYCHGGPYIIQRILKTLFGCGVRQANPGEFTQRAYLNGKMDLTQAEGINQLVNAQSHQQWMAARQLAEGRLAETINELRSMLISAMAHLEAKIDFPDEGETSDIGLDFTKTNVKNVLQKVEQLIDSYENGRVASTGLSVALIGAPNAGKSTLLNHLLGKDRAIVTDIEGTTRDYIEEGCLVLGRFVRLIDTAGIRESEETVEQIGVEASKKIMAKADLVVFLCASDASKERVEELTKLLSENKAKPHLKILTKADLTIPDWARDWIKISCLENQGIDELKKEIASVVDTHVEGIKEQTFITSIRHAQALEKARTFLANFFQAEEEGRYDECLAFELQEASRALTSIIGQVGTDDILDEVFSRFCLGK